MQLQAYSESTCKVKVVENLLFKSLVSSEKGDAHFSRTPPPNTSKIFQWKM